MSKTADYNESGISELARYAHHFWFAHRNQVILDYIERHCRLDKMEFRILELGAGSGNICCFLKQQGYRIDASDFYESALGHFKDCVEHSFVFDVVNDPVPAESQGIYDLLILGDIIEHLSEPVSSLKRVRPFLKHKGKILVTVPALMQLWSSYDEECGHKRRYTAKTLADTLKEAGYSVVEVRYFMCIPALILFVRRKAQGIFGKRKSRKPDSELEISESANKVMNHIMQIEYRVGRIIRFPFGSSVIAFADCKSAKP